MEKRCFDLMYDSVINRDYYGDEKAKKRLLRFDGKKKLQQTLNDDEEILAISYAMSTDDPAVVSIFMISGS